MLDLLLDPAIRLWVVIPIVIITFCAGLCRHYAMQLLQTTPCLEKDVLIRKYVYPYFTFVMSLAYAPTLQFPCQNENPNIE